MTSNEKAELPPVAGSASISEENDTMQATGKVLTPTVAEMADLLPNHELYGEIGRVVAEFAHLEHGLDVIIWKMLGVKDHVGACVTSQLTGPSPRSRTIRLLANQLTVTDEFLSILDEISEVIGKAQSKRNRIVHDAWFVSSTGLHQFRAFPESARVFGMKDIDAAFLHQTLTEIGEVRKLIRSLAQMVQI